MSTIQDSRKTWLATRKLPTDWWKIPSLGPRLQQTLAFFLWLSHTCCYDSSVGSGLYSAGWISFCICSICCSVSGPGCASEPFLGKALSLSLFLFSSSPAIPQFQLLSLLSSFRLSSGHSGLVLTPSTDYASHTSLSNPHMVVADTSIWVTSLLAVTVRLIF